MEQNIHDTIISIISDNKRNASLYSRLYRFMDGKNFKITERILDAIWLRYSHCKDMSLVIDLFEKDEMVFHSQIEKNMVRFITGYGCQNSGHLSFMIMVASKLDKKYMKKYNEKYFIDLANNTNYINLNKIEKIIIIKNKLKLKLKICDMLKMIFENGIYIHQSIYDDDGISTNLLRWITSVSTTNNNIIKGTIYVTLKSFEKILDIVAKNRYIPDINFIFDIAKIENIREKEMKIALLLKCHIVDQKMLGDLIILKKYFNLDRMLAYLFDKTYDKSFNTQFDDNLYLVYFLLHGEKKVPKRYNYKGYIFDKEKLINMCKKNSFEQIKKFAVDKNLYLDIFCLVAAIKNNNMEFLDNIEKCGVEWKTYNYPHISSSITLEKIMSGNITMEDYSKCVYKFEEEEKT